MTDWARTAAWWRTIGLVVLSLGLGLALGRADVVVLGAPLLLGFVVARTANGGPGAPVPSAAASVDQELVGGSGAAVRTALRDLDGAELVTVLLPGEDGRPTGRTAVLRGGSGGDREVHARFATRSWGRMPLARPDLMAISADGLFSVGPIRGSEVSELVLPAVEGIPPLELPPISGGWAGAHTSRRLGAGSDLVDLREFAPGDRMRSVHWRAFARHGRLYARRTLSEADAEIVLCLDVRTEIGPRVAAAATSPLARLRQRALRGVIQFRAWWARRNGGESADQQAAQQQAQRRSSLDLTVAATAAIASAHLGAGDRVGVMTTGRRRQVIRPGTGTRHLQRIRYFLARLEEYPGRALPVEWWGLRSSAVVLLVTGLADDQAVESALDCAARGHRIVAVDVLPISGMARAAKLADLDHLRVLAVEHGLRVARLRTAGVPVLTWESGDIQRELAEALRAMRSRR